MERIKQISPLRCKMTNLEILITPRINIQIQPPSLLLVRERIDLCRTHQSFDSKLIGGLLTHIQKLSKGIRRKTHRDRTNREMNRPAVAEGDTAETSVFGEEEAAD
jgi:hypothetical protein